MQTENNRDQWMNNERVSATGEINTMMIKKENFQA